MYIFTLWFDLTHTHTQTNSIPRPRSWEAKNFRSLVKAKALSDLSVESI